MPGVALFGGDSVKMAVNGKESQHGPVTLLPQDNYLISLMTTLRDSLTNSAAFVNAFEKVAGQLMIAGAERIPSIRLGCSLTKRSQP